jgi:tetratricopeptide (TPR) repeat protein
MPTLRFTYSAKDYPDRVGVALEGDGPLQGAVSFLPSLDTSAQHPRDQQLIAHWWASVGLQQDAQDQENVRWYLEDYLHYPAEPAPTIAARVEERLPQLGAQLFGHLFPHSSDARTLWQRVRHRLGETRIEVVTDPAGGQLPWELLHDPAARVPLALRARAFVRGHPQPVERSRLRQDRAERIRILLVICRPGGAEDVPFRSVASQLVRVRAEASTVFELEVLRPPTFIQLDRVLRNAAEAGRPYDVVHFDGHGIYADQPVEPGGRGYLIFENPETTHNRQFVDGAKLGALLVESDVPLLVVNACRSAHAGVAPRPRTLHELDVIELRARTQAYGSLAHEVVSAGVAGVVAMRYNVYVVTAAKFLADLYVKLLQGQPLGEAVTLGRRQLAAQPNREIAFTPRPLQDWVVPVVYEAAPVRLFPVPRSDQPVVIRLDRREARQKPGQPPAGLPGRPDVGFWGRDDILLALDRAFDANSLVLLHGSAGAGKTTTAVEFARWYQLTGGVRGPILFTSFEQFTPLARVLDRIGETFADTLEANGIRWSAFTDRERFRAAVQVLKQVPALWIWDSIEPVAGFPSCTQSAWSKDEQAELAQFLRALQATKAKVLLTSRRHEFGWLDDLPARVVLPPMPTAERLLLAKAIAKEHGYRIEVEDWRSLLSYTQGNPLTVTVVVGQALHDGLHTRPQVEEFVARLRAGAVTLVDERADRTQSIGASLGYGFTHAFTEAERAQLALLHLFQGFVDVEALLLMGRESLAENALPAVQDLTRTAGIDLLNRVTEVGLLTSYGSGFYGIHPALPWYLTELFTDVYGPAASATAMQATHAYAIAISALGNHWAGRYERGQSGAIDTLRAEEDNLLHALCLARAQSWWLEVVSAMQGLHVLYEHSGRMAEWAQLVDQLTPDLVDPATDRPRPGCEEQWRVITGYRVRLAWKEHRDLATAERLQRMAVAWDRARAAAALAIQPEALGDAQWIEVYNLAVSMHELGQILLERRQTTCVEAFSEALELAARLRDRRLEAITAHNLGRAYRLVPGLHDLDQAERWCKHSLDLLDETEDRPGRARCLSELGRVYNERLRQALDTGKPPVELFDYLNAAIEAQLQALHLLPADAVLDLAATHSALGYAYSNAGEVDAAIGHWWEAIRYHEAAGDRYNAARNRYAAAAALTSDSDKNPESYGRLDEALTWAQTALRDYQTQEDEAADELAQSQQLIAAIKQRMAAGITSPLSFVTSPPPRVWKTSPKTRGKRQQARSLSQLGSMHNERFRQALDVGRPPTELFDHLNAAIDAYMGALHLLPADANSDRAAIHAALGRIYDDAGQLTTDPQFHQPDADALGHWREAIRYYEVAGDRYNVARNCHDVAVALTSRGRLGEALPWFGDALLSAHAALREHQAHGDRTTDEIREIQRLIIQTEQVMAVARRSPIPKFRTIATSYQERP